MNRYRRGVLGAWMVTLWVSSVALPAAADQTFGYTSRKPQLWETERPVLEEEPGTNLYWHDPILGSWEHCRAFPASANGCPPQWYGRVEMLALFRDPQDSFEYASLGPAGPTALGTGDFKPEFDAGVRALIGMSLGSWYRLEVSYFGSHAWDDGVTIRNLDPNSEGGLGNLYSPFSAFGDPAGLAGFDYNELASVRFESRLNNGELNLRRRVLMRPGSYEASVLLGGRYLEIGEQFDYLTQSTTPVPATTAFAVDTRNKMIGFQIGLLSQFLMQPRCWIDFEMKGGVYQNRTSFNRAFFTTGLNDGFDVFAGSDQRDRTSFVGDLSLQYNYQFAPSWTFYAGYNAMWVTGLALAERNFVPDAGLLTLGPPQIDHAGQVVYHGPNIGLVFSR
jgi:hypothetical protein